MLSIINFPLYKHQRFFTFLRILDLFHLIFNMIFQVILLSTYILLLMEYIFEISMIISSFFLGLCCFQSLYADYLRRDACTHLKFIMFRLVFMIENFFRLILSYILIGTKSKFYENDMQMNSFFLLNFFWLIIDVYFFIVACTFYKKVKRGVYNPVGGSLIYPFMKCSLDFKEAIIYEFNGDIMEDEEKCVENGFVVSEKKNERTKKNANKKKYLLFPLNFFRKGVKKMLGR